mmetsp:Transcript_58858/g.170761  ORF Transcript_58858/g.170761 Transcript_58858/m.170761 type:complete len:212 (+) Transcript_58858:1053-1688(+)
MTHNPSSYNCVAKIGSSIEEESPPLQMPVHDSAEAFVETPGASTWSWLLSYKKVSAKATDPTSRRVSVRARFGACEAARKNAAESAAASPMCPRDTGTSSTNRFAGNSLQAAAAPSHSAYNWVSGKVEGHDNMAQSFRGEIASSRSQPLSSSPYGCVASSSRSMNSCGTARRALVGHMRIAAIICPVLHRTALFRGSVSSVSQAYPRWLVT